MWYYAKDLRNKTQLYSVTYNPGCYKWWAPKEVVKELLDSTYLEGKYFSSLIDNLEKKTFNGVEYYYIYVGIAVKESIRQRLNWHINQKHTPSCVRYGTLSTLRQSIASLVCGCQLNQNATNEIIDKLIVEYEECEFPIKSTEAKAIIESCERDEMEHHVLPLNIRDNKRIEVADFKKELSSARSKAKQIVNKTQI